MLTITDYIKNTSNGAQINKPQNNVQKAPILSENKTDTFNSKKSKAKKAIKVGSVIVGALLTIGAIIKRKEIGKFFSKAAGNADEIKNSKTLNNTLDKVKNANATTEVAKNISDEIAKVDKVAKEINKNFIPMPNFKDNPSSVEKKEYLKSLVKYIGGEDKDLNIQAINMVGKYGDYEDANYLSFVLGDKDDEIQQAMIKAYKKISDPNSIIMAADPLKSSSCYTDKTYLMSFDAVKEMYSDKISANDKKRLIRIANRYTINQSEEVMKKAKEVIEYIEKQ